ncbi:SAICAR synthase-like protein [Coprinopsis marcescibilis]|uniref:Kinase n=1 Tax=Coprinopsis marcescibilis TaxID=230819 RepID=A0A5C3KEL0_COPMA|nr:SAICAR synthase-like protein [Coprinopsis marcescibilis]
MATVLANQVGGHAGVMTAEDGSLIIKPCLKRELEFYRLLQNSTEDNFVKLSKFTPKFLGTLTLEGQLSGQTAEGVVQIEPVQAAEKESIVLENLTYKFSKPNVLDIKLGTVLYDEGASEDKVQRMIKTAKETTSFETGVRLTGFQVYDNHTQLAVNTPKSYGKSIKPSDLADGIAKFFPVGLTRGDEEPSEEGRLGLPAQTILPILTSIRSEIAQIKEALSGIDMRMVGGSLLVVYEADWEKAAVGIKNYLETPPEDRDDVDDEEDDEEESDAEDQAPPRAFNVKLIDFAHTKVEAGLGPDEGVLLGVNTVLNLLDGRINQIKDKYKL